VVRLSRAEFERLVAQAVDALPPKVARHLENVEIVVEDAPTPEELESAGQDPDETLLGIYQGVPQSQRGSWYGSVLPDRIILYQRPIEAAARTKPGIRREVHITLLHEIGHHFGLDESELAEAGYE
jgi:predicted Zn-dependent protease with MMP-like domain